MSMLSNDVSFERASILLNHQRVPTRWLGRALEWHSRGQRFDPAYLHHLQFYIVTLFHLGV